MEIALRHETAAAIRMRTLDSEEAKAAESPENDLIEAAQ
jgi:hypothetical protein